MSNDQPTPSKIKRHWSLEEKKLHYEAWRKSSLSLNKFCQENSIPLSSLSKWAKEFESKKVEPMTFLPVTAQENLTTEMPTLELKFANGLQCRLTSCVNIPLVLELIRGLCHVVNSSK